VRAAILSGYGPYTTFADNEGVWDARRRHWPQWGYRSSRGRELVLEEQVTGRSQVANDQF
jgi:hypothetical protein